MNWPRLTLLLWILAVPAFCRAAKDRLAPIPLDGAWVLLPDPAGAGRKDAWAERGFPPKAETVQARVPGAWQRYLPGYHGAAFYEKRFDCPNEFGPRVFLRIGAANYRAEGWLNGVYLGTHDGGYYPFSWEVTGALHRGGENRLVIRIVHSPPGESVEETALGKIPSSKETWYYPYSGILGSVSLEPGADPSIDRLEIIPLEKEMKVLIKAMVSTSRAEAFRGAITFKVGRIGRVFPVRLNTDANPGNTCVIEETIPMGRFKRWTIEKPVLYRLNAILSKGGNTINERSAAFGMRGVDFKDGFFYLNGRREILRGILLQPNYPVGLGTPPDSATGIKDLEKIKSLGFNLVRSHLKPLSEEQLDFCDANGLMVYEEPAIAWMAEDDPEKALRIASAEVRALVSGHINHPSVVLWGISNENGRFAGESGARLLSLAASIDPSRPVIDVSGRSMSIRPEGGWMNETRLRRPGAASDELIEDHHHCLRSPVGSAERGILEHLGGPDMPSYEDAGYGPTGQEAAFKKRLAVRRGGIFVSEFGCGGLMDFERVLAGFDDFRKAEISPPFTATALADESDYRAIYTELESGFRRRGLEREFLTVTGFIEACQAQQTKGVRRQIESMRMNERISGYILAQFNDASWECNAGVVDVWRGEKLVAGVLPMLNAPWLLVARPSAAVVETGYRAAFTIEILGADKLPPATVLEYRVFPPGEEPVGEISWTLTSTARASSLEIPVNTEQPGRWLLRARLRRRASVLSTAEAEIHAGPWGERSQISFSCAQDPSILGPFRTWIIPEKDSQLIVITFPNSLAKRDLARVLKAVRKGKKAIFMPIDPVSMAKLAQEKLFPLKGKPRNTISTFMGRFHHFRRTRFTGGLPGIGPRTPTGYLADEVFADLLPVYSLPEAEKAVIHAGCIGMKVRIAERDEGDWLFLADVMEVPFGKGRLVFCQYRLAGKLESSPLARELFYRLLMI